MRKFIIVYTTCAFIFLATYTFIGIYNADLLSEIGFHIWLSFLGLVMIIPKILSPKIGESYFNQLNAQINKYKMKKVSAIIYLLGATNYQNYNRRLNRFLNLSLLIGLALLYPLAYKIISYI